MPALNIIDNQHARLVYHDDDKIVHSTMHQDINSEAFRTVMDTGVDLMTKHEARKWLSDNREIGPHSEEDSVWINSEWLPHVIATGWKYWALVVPHDAKARMNMVEFVNSFYEQGVRVRVFTDVEPAMDWLRAAES